VYHELIRQRFCYRFFLAHLDTPLGLHNSDEPAKRLEFREPSPALLSAHAELEDRGEHSLVRDAAVHPAGAVMDGAEGQFDGIARVQIWPVRAREVVASEQPLVLLDCTDHRLGMLCPIGLGETFERPLGLYSRRGQ